MSYAITNPEAKRSSMNKWKTWIVYLLAIVAVCAAYSQLPYADFLNYDDNDYVTANQPSIVPGVPS